MRSLVLPTLAFALATASEVPGTYHENATDYATALRAHLLNGYDKHVPPKSNRSAYGTSGGFTNTGTDVRMQIKFFKVQTVDAHEGSMKIKVWLRMYWEDRRLSWDPSDYGGLEYTQFWADISPGSSSYEIWLPDVQPYNSMSAIASTLDPTYLKVDYRGDIFYSRPGTLEVMCKFSGLSRFPYDRLKCPMDWGGWGMSGMQQGIVLHDGGYVNGYENEFAAGASYQEHTITDISVRVRAGTYDASFGAEPWPIVSYVVTLQRAHLFYTLVIILPTMLITLLSFAVFWSDPSAADSLGYGVNIIVVSVLMQVVVITYLPVCGEILWIDLFLIINVMFCVISLAESIFTMMLTYNDGSRLLFTCLAPVELKRRVLKSLRKEAEDGGPPPSSPEGQQPSGEATPSFKRLMRSRSAKTTAQIDANIAIDESVAGLLYRKMADERGVTAEAESAAGGLSAASVLAKQLAEERHDDGDTTARMRRASAAANISLSLGPEGQGQGSAHGVAAAAAAARPSRSATPMESEDLHKLAFYESLFFVADENM